MRRKNDMIPDIQHSFWGGNIYDGLSKSNTICAGYTIMAGYIDKMLGPYLRKRFEDHLASCRECREDIQEIRKMLKFINN